MPALIVLILNLTLCGSSLAMQPILSMSTSCDFVDRSSDLKGFENGVKNKFKWCWLESKNDNGDYINLET